MPEATIAREPAPLSGWRRLAADMAAVGGSTLVCQVLGAATSLLLRAALSPAQMGVWQGLKLLLGYANYANLGVSKGAARELAVAAGSSQAERAERGLNLAFTVNTLTSFIYGLCLAGAAVWLDRRPGMNRWSLGLLAMAVLVVLGRHLTFHVTILRCRQAFVLASWVSFVEGALTLLLAGLGAWRWGLAGLYAGTALTMLGTLVFLRCQGVAPFRVDWHWSEIKRLVAIGGPILLGGLALGLFQSLDKLMLLGFSADRAFELGCYSTALLISAQIYGLANMFAMVVWPRYAELFGRTGSKREVARLAARASELLAAATSAAAVLGLVVVVPFLGWLFPAYRPGLPPAGWLVPGIALFALTLPLNQYLVAVCQERAALVAAMAALAAAAVGDYAALVLGHGMMGVAAATAMVDAGFYLLMVALSIWPQLDGAARRRYLWTHAALLLPVVLAVSLADFSGRTFAGMSLARQTLTALAAWGACASIVWRRGAWCQAWRAGAMVPARPTVGEQGRSSVTDGDDREQCPPYGRPPCKRLSLDEMAARCQKPDYRLRGNWMARNVSRPMALRVTWVIAPSGVSAHAVTCIALLIAWGAAACFARGAPLVGALLWQVWYLIDHVDGQIARLRGTSSLDGIQLDYLMHHLVNLILPCGMGYGLWRVTGQECWLPLGFMFAIGVLLLSLANDTRYKAFMARLKELDGMTLSVCVSKPECGAAGESDSRISEARGLRLVRRIVHVSRKLCEVHVLMNTMTMVAVLQSLAGSLQPMQIYVALMAPLALGTAVATLTRDIRRGAAEREFARLVSARINDHREPDEKADERAEPEIMTAGDFVAAGDG